VRHTGGDADAITSWLAGSRDNEDDKERDDTMGRASRRKRDRSGIVSANQYGKVIRMHPEVHNALLKQRAAFVEKFGREPGPNDPVFFDPDADTPQPFPRQTYHDGMLEMLRAMGAAPEIIYAFEKTGRIVTAETMPSLTDAELAEWDAAIAEYHAQVTANCA
jgi:hypothetical protein